MNLTCRFGDRSGTHVPRHADVLLAHVCRVCPTPDQQRPKPYASESLGVGLDNTVYALDSTTSDLCLSVFPWANFGSTKAAVKMHTLLDLRGAIPSFIHVSDGRFHDVNVLDLLLSEAKVRGSNPLGCANQIRVLR